MEREIGSVLFSVIIPTYNRSNSIKNALKSLVDQTFKNFEVIIVDDGSTDNTSEVVETYRDKLDIKYLWTPNWGGPAKPRNIGISMSKGEWICFLDSDDWWYPEKLKECQKYTANYDLIFHPLDIVTPNQKTFFKRKMGFAPHDNLLKDLIVYGNSIANSGAIVNKNILKEVGDISEDPSQIAIEDFEYWLRVAHYTNKFKYINQVLGGYIWNGKNNISHVSLVRIEREKKLFYKYLPLLNNKERFIACQIFNYKTGRFYGMLGLYDLGLPLIKDSIYGKSFYLTLKSLLYYFIYKFNIIINR